MNLMEKVMNLNESNLQRVYQIAKSKDVYNDFLMDTFESDGSFTNSQLEEITKVCKEVAEIKQVSLI
ncbi:hypothetical protein LYSIN_01194 [Lysinibacillus sphaericus]|uniref:Uncharacterized protein n=1 Tax=Lysinibacillus sphaericus TaxID=1421 RepID=A0A2S5D030_LYSSH|nr:hypothetical protein [Lysinibacillus sphaericus]POZ56411.1 hypothetical protein LYSIN_01194 [Lysinibacillus sphaericus]